LSKSRHRNGPTSIPHFGKKLAEWIFAVTVPDLVVSPAKHQLRENPTKDQPRS
jgi:hypothetical protein